MYLLLVKCVFLIELDICKPGREMRVLKAVVEIVLGRDMHFP